MFGSLQVAQKMTRMDVKSTFGISELRDNIVTEQGGAIVNPVGNAEYDLSVSTDGGRSLLRTVERGRYVAGITAEVGIGVRLSSSPYTGNQSFRWGYFDDQNGMFFQKDADGMSVGIMRDGVQTELFPQSSWNVDRLDGSGPSESVLDLSRGNIFQIIYTWYGYGAVAFRIVVTNGGNQFVQTIHRYAPNGGTSVKNPNLPLYAELSNPGVTDPSATTAIRAYVAGRQYSIIGDVHSTNFRLTSPFVLDVSADNTFSSIMNIRRKAGYLGNPIRVSAIEVITDSIVLYQIRLNALQDPEGAAYGDIPDTRQSETALEQNTSLTTLSDTGIVLFAGFATPGSGGVGRGNTSSSGTARAVDHNLENGEVLSLCIRAFDGAATVSGVLRITEEW